MHNKVSCWKKVDFSRCLKPFKKQELHEVQEDGNGCCPVQKKALFTGLSDIAKSKRCRRMAIKLFVFFLCTSGFLYQTWTFLQMYLAYPTTLEISEEYPDEFTIPAITICNRNRFWRQRYCNVYPIGCSWEHTTWESFCEKYRRMCPNIKPPDFNFGIPGIHALTYPDSRGLMLRFAGPIIDESTIPIFKSFDKQYMRKTFQEIKFSKNGLQYECFILKSHPVIPNRELEKTKLADGYTILVDLHPEEYMNTNDLVQAAVVLHDPRKSVNPMTEGINLGPGKLHVLFPTVERTERLPPPYASNCKDYLTEWTKNAGSGPLSKDDCINECKIHGNLIKYGCVGQSMTYPFGYTFSVCNHPFLEPSSEDHRMCADTCQDACEENIYRVTADEAPDISSMCNSTDEYCKSHYLSIHISFNRLKVKKVKQIPRIESIELFSYIGGYLGMWLSISIASVFDLAEMIYDVIQCAFLKLKRKKNRKQPIE